MVVGVVGDDFDWCVVVALVPLESYVEYGNRKCRLDELYKQNFWPTHPCGRVPTTGLTNKRKTILAI